MNLIETEFSKELSELLNKYSVSIGYDKDSLILDDDNCGTKVLIGDPVTGSDGTEKRLYMCDCV